MWVGSTRRDLLAFLLTLSFSRAWELVWSERKHLLEWLSVHNAALQRLGGCRLRSESTMRRLRWWPEPERRGHSIGSTNAMRRRFVPTSMPAPGRSSEAKGNVERRIRDGRAGPLPPAPGGARGTPDTHRRASSRDDAPADLPGHRYRPVQCLGARARPPLSASRTDAGAVRHRSHAPRRR